MDSWQGLVVLALMELLSNDHLGNTLDITTDMSQLSIVFVLFAVSARCTLSGSGSANGKDYDIITCQNGAR